MSSSNLSAFLGKEIVFSSGCNVLKPSMRVSPVNCGETNKTSMAKNTTKKAAPTKKVIVGTKKSGISF